MLTVESEGPVLRVSIDRPEVRNALNDELIAQLTTVFSHLSRDMRAVVLTGTGDAFCAGGDLQWMRKAAGYTPEQNVQDALGVYGLFQSIVDCRAVVIARINGACFGGGCGLAAAADFAVAAEGAVFAFSEVKLGLVPATISRFVVEKIGAGHARHLFATGEAFDAAHAQRVGLIQEVVSSDLLDAAVNKRLKAVLAAGPEAVASAKRLAQAHPLDAESAAQLLAETRASDEAKEGIAAFLEKRKAAFVANRGRSRDSKAVDRQSRRDRDSRDPRGPRDGDSYRGSL